MGKGTFFVHGSCYDKRRSLILLNSLRVELLKVGARHVFHMGVHLLLGLLVLVASPLEHESNSSGHAANTHGEDMLVQLRVDANVAGDEKRKSGGAMNTRVISMLEKSRGQGV